MSQHNLLPIYFVLNHSKSTFNIPQSSPALLLGQMPSKDINENTLVQTALLQQMEHFLSSKNAFLLKHVSNNQNANNKHIKINFCRVSGTSILCNSDIFLSSFLNCKIFSFQSFHLNYSYIHSHHIYPPHDYI